MDNNSMESPICRACLVETSSFIGLKSQHDSGLSFLEVFNLCTKELNATQDDGFPQNLCNPCTLNLTDAFKFMKQAKESDRILKERITFKDSKLEKKNFEDNFTHVKDELYIEEYHSREEESNDDIANPDVSSQSEEKPISDLKRHFLRVSKDRDKKENVGQLEKSLNCKTCEKTFKTVRGFKLHMMSVHKNKKIHLCNICGKTCTQKASLESHLLQHKGERPFSCEICNKTYFTKNGLQSHMIGHSNEKSLAKFLCSICGRSFVTAQRLRVHNLVHTGEKNFCCDVCSKKFATPFRLRNHLRVHTGERPFECSECGIKFAQSNALKCHQRIHTGEKPYECNICGKRFNQNTILKTHMTLHTGKTVKCPHCDKKFSRPSYLILHQRDHTGEKPYACHKCPNRYKQKSHLDRHLDTHFGIRHKCDECGKQYSKRSSLKIHMFEHSEQKPYQCSECVMPFTRKDKYKNHLLKIHNKVLVCDEVAEIVKVDDNEITETQQIILELPVYSQLTDSGLNVETVEVINVLESE